MRCTVLLCILGSVVQLISSQCIRNPSLPCRPVLSSAVLGEGNLNICSDDLLISGPVTIAGKLPFSGTVVLEGSLPAAGSGAVRYGCEAPVGIIRETPLGTVAGYGFRT